MSTTPVDWTDPCQRAAALTNAYYNLLSGQQEVDIRTRTGDAEERVHFAIADINMLRSEMQDAQSACALQQGGQSQSKRFAIALRFKRRGSCFGFGRFG